MSEDEIAELVSDFAKSASLLHSAGYDGAELHAAHGYLLAQFLSPLGNKRLDRYGLSTIENRTRLLREILSAIRQRCPENFVIGVRLSVAEQVPNGLQLEDTRRIVEMLEATNTIQYLSLTVGIRGNYVKDGSASPAFAEQDVAAIKKHTDLPVVIAGRITSPEVAEDILTRGTADMIGLGRALVADPNFAIKALKGENIRPCIAGLRRVP
jgi:2,4-dienoyl-CoA reductase (NADPH2)